MKLVKSYQENWQQFWEVSVGHNLLYIDIILGDAFYRPTRLKKAGRTGTSFEGIQLIFMDQTIAALGFFKQCKENYENESG